MHSLGASFLLDNLITRLQTHIYQDACYCTFFPSGVKIDGRGWASWTQEAAVAQVVLLEQADSRMSSLLSGWYHSLRHLQPHILAWSPALALPPCAHSRQTVPGSRGPSGSAWVCVLCLVSSICLHVPYFPVGNCGCCSQLSSC